MIVSFERGGVSGHLNHVSTSIGAEMARNALKRNSFNSDNSDSERKCTRKGNEQEEEESCEGDGGSGGVKVKKSTYSSRLTLNGPENGLSVQDLKVERGTPVQICKKTTCVRTRAAGAANNKYGKIPRCGGAV